MSKKRKKPALTPWSLGSLPITPVAVKNPDAPEDRATLLKRLQDEEEQQRLAADPVHQSIVAQSKAVSELRRLSISYWSRPIAQIIADGDCESAKDVTFSVPALRNEYTFDDARRAFDQGYALIVKSGYELTETGGQLLVRFGLSQGRLNGADMSNGAAWVSAFSHLKDELGVFSDDDFAKQPRKVAAPEPKPSIDDLEKIAITAGTDSERRARHLVTTLMTAEIQPIADRWYAHLNSDYQFVATDSQHKWIMDWFHQSGANPMIHDSWNIARRSAVDAKIFPSHMRTRDEILSRAIEQGAALGTLGFNDKQELFAQMKRMRDPV